MKLKNCFYDAEVTSKRTHVTKRYDCSLCRQDVIQDVMELFRNKFPEQEILSVTIRKVYFYNFDYEA